ncbi:fimbria/pilus outer membrane usher protein [Enterobacter cloacae]|uniref:fimbria/pilus outer membrane usher protein n=1 Tax=Enterobacter cloacae TaxID=550 RepID=UPI0020058583|nr:fimbria/pilus outer membrane usher protein [Enterobacter cloacae]MCK7340964.1 fimbria/pilus outer membrane usher protein [Enterobacter cloacae]
MPASSPCARSLLALLLWLTLMLTAQAEPAADTVQWLAITVNHAPRGELWACRVVGEALWIDRGDLKKLGLRAPDDHSEWVELTSLPGLKVSLDLHAQQVSLTADAKALDGQQRLTIERPTAQYRYPEAQPISAFTLGYALYASDSQGNRQLNAQTSLTASGALPGTFSSSFSSHAGEENSAGRPSHTRLETRWQWDNADSLTSLALGDSITTGTRWSRQVRFGGLHWARNFELDPQLNTEPRSRYSDTAVLPSTVDLYIDGLKQSSQRVTPGDFLLDTLPSFTGSGQAQVVITDINGQRRTVQLDLYGAPGMLAEGLSSGSLDIGWMRQNYALRSNDYAPTPVLDAGWRYGVSNQLTLALHTEQQSKLRNVGTGVDWLISPDIGIVSQHVALSDSPYGLGKQWGLGWQWNGSGTGLSASTVRTDADFADNARTIGALPVRRSDSVWLSHSVPHFGTVGAGWVQQNIQGNKQRYLNASWSVSLPAHLSTTLSYTRSFTDASSNVQLMLSVPLGRADTLSVQTSRETSRMDYRHQPDDRLGGWSWQLGQSVGERRDTYADVGYLGHAGEWHVGLEQGAKLGNQYASAEGSLTLLDGSPHALRYSQQSLALVSTHGVGHVPVMLENRPAGETDENGYLLLTDLPQYHSSKVSINPLDLPADVMAPVTDIDARPGNGSAVKVDFNVHHAVTVQARLVDSRHKPLPLGSIVSTPRGATIVGRDGFIWLEDPPLPGELVVKTGEGECRVTLPAPRAASSIQNIGEQLCH